MLRSGRFTWRLSATLPCALAGVLGGCNYPPSIGVSGAYFPDWLFCWTAGVMLVVAGHQLLRLLGITGWILYAPLTYPLIAGALASVVWLTFFTP